MDLEVQEVEHTVAVIITEVQLNQLNQEIQELTDLDFQEVLEPLII